MVENVFPFAEERIVPESDDNAWSDYGKAAAVGVRQLGAGIKAGARYLHEQAGNEEDAQAEAIYEHQEQRAADDWKQSMTPAGRKALDAGVTSGDFWDHPLRSTFLKGAATAPSIAASAIPAAIAAPVLGPMAAAAAAGAIFQTTDFLEGVDRQIDGMTDEELTKASDLYAGLRQRMDEREARLELKNEATNGSGRILANAIVGGLTEIAGPAGMAARATVKGGRAILNQGAKGITGKLLAGAGEGALSEGTQEGAGAATSQLASQAIGLQHDFDWNQWFDQTAQGAGLGAIFGGGIGAAEGIGHPQKKPKSKVEVVGANGIDSTTAAGLAEATGVTTEAPANEQGTPPAGVPTAGAATVTPEQEAVLSPPYSGPMDDELLPWDGEPDFGEDVHDEEPAVADDELPGANDPVLAGALQTAPATAPHVQAAPEITPEVAPAAKAPATQVPNSADTTPETLAQLSAQITDLSNGVRRAVLLPNLSLDQAKNLGRQNGLLGKMGAIQFTDTSEGLVVHSRRLKAEEVKWAADNGRLNDILNMGPTTKAKALKDEAAGAKGVGVVTRKPNGVPVVEQASTSLTADQDVAAQQALAAPGDTVTVEDPAKIIADRQAGVTPEVNPVRKIEITPELRAKYEGKANAPAPVAVAEQPVRAPAPVAPARTDVPAKARPSTGRVLTPVGESPVVPLSQLTEAAITPEEVQAAEAKAAAEASAPEPVEEKPKGGNRTKKEKTKVRNNNEIAADVVLRHPGDVNVEQHAHSDSPQGAAARKAIRERITAMVEEAKRHGYKPPRYRAKGAVEEMQPNGASIILRDAFALYRKLTDKKAKRPEKADWQEFLRNEVLAKSGAHAEIIANSKMEGDLAFKKNGSAKNEKDEEVNTGEEPRRTIEREEVTAVEDEALDNIDSQREAEIEAEEKSEAEKLRERLAKEKAEQKAKLEARRAESAAIQAKAAEAAPKATPQVVVQKRPKIEIAKPAGKVTLAPRKQKVDAIAFGPNDAIVRGSASAEDIKALGFEADGSGSWRSVRVTTAERGTAHVKPIASTTAHYLLRSLRSRDLKGAIGKMFPILRERLLKTRLLGDHLAEHINVHILSDEQFDQLGHTNTLAFYDPNDGHIFLRESNINRGPTEFARIVMHETVHAITSRYLRTDNPYHAALMKLMNDVTAQLITEGKFDHLVGSKRPYGLTNTREFIAEAFSNAAFQKLLRRTPISRELAETLGLPAWRKQSTFAAFVNWVRKLLKLPEATYSALDASISIGEDMMDLYDSDGLMGSGDRTVGSFEYPASWQRSLSFDTVPTFDVDTLSVPSRGDVTREVARAGVNFGHVRRTLGNKLATFSQLAYRASKVFSGDHVQTIADLREGMRVAKTKILEKEGGNEVVRTLAAIERKYGGKMWDAFTTLAYDATSANVNLGPNAKNDHLGKDAAKGWQAKARLADMQRRYNAMPAEMKAAFQQAAAFGRDMQNAETLALINNILEAAGVGDQKLAQSIFSQTFRNEAELVKAGVPKGIAGALLSAKELHKLGGTYFPMMRRGNFVTSGKIELKVPAHGLKISDSVVQFADASDTKARKQAKAFAEQNDLSHVATKKVYVHKNDPTQIVEPQDADAIPAYRLTFQTQHTEFHETLADAQDAAVRLKQDGLTDVYATPREEQRSGQSANMMSHEMMRVMNSLAQRADFKAMPKASQDQLTDALKEASVRFLGSTRVQSRALPRRNVAGYSRALTRNMADYANSSAGYLAQLRYRPRIDAAMKALREEVRDKRFSTGAEQRQELYNEVSKRLFDMDDFALPNSMGETVTRRLLQVSMLDKLAGVSFHIINSTEPWTTAAPMLIARHGFKAAAALSRAYRTIGGFTALKGGLVDTVKAFNQNDEFTDHLGRIKRNLTAEQAALIDHLYDVGLLDNESGFDLRHVSNPAGNVFGRGLDRADLMARQVGQAIEVINRTVTALAAYELERSKGATPEVAGRYAKEIVHDTMGNYSASNAPAVFKHPIGRIALQFKKFGQKTYYLLGKLIAKSAKGDPEAMRQFAGLMVTHAAVAGLLGLPTEPFKVALMTAGFFGLTNYTWDDVEAVIRGVATDALGKDLGEAATRGMPRLAGIDVSGRYGLNSLLTYGQPKSAKEDDLWAYFGKTLAGAPGGTLLDILQGSRLVANGEFSKGVQRLSPIKGVTDVLKAGSLYMDGQRASGSGRQTMEPFILPEAIAKGIGFSPARESENFEQSSYFNRNMERQKRNRDYWVGQWVNAGPDERARLWGRIEDVNKGLPKEARITRASLDSAVKRRKSEKTVNGVRVERTNQHIMDDARSTYNLGS